jgi:iron complex transport system permease protein
VLPFIGAVAVPLSALFSNSDNLAATILWQSRIPRTLCAFVAGGTLSVCGLALQSSFRNPLASPFTLGISSGGALGAVIGIAVFGGSLEAFLPQYALCSLLGAGITCTLVALLSRVSRLKEGTHFLLAGVSLALLLGNLTVLVQYFADVSGLIATTRWMLGTVQVADPKILFVLFVLCLSAVVGVFFIRKELDLLIVGKDFAASKGVNIKSTEILLFCFTSLGVGSVVSFCGPVGFIGVIEPYLARLLFGRSHRILIPISFMFGGVLLAVCDALGRIMWPPIEIPAGLLSGIIGALAFALVIMRGK